MTKAGKRICRRDANGNKLVKDDVLFLIKDDPKWMARLAYIVQKKIEVNKLIKESEPNV